ncbi:DUF2927 domain-containing protein [Larkinella insperata]|uniref:DUF2927 domain-containing protein n=1 Tax=Larkinella insperata TaxID=332158 RepID=A0ABW3Q7D0_9BACT
MQCSHSILGILAVFFILSSCGLNDQQPGDFQKVALLKKTYSVAAINYFYETVFHQDEDSAKLGHLSKWKSNPQILVGGNPSAEEIGYVKDAVARINQMNLSIACQLTNQASTDGIEICFGSVDQAAQHLKAERAIAQDADPNRHLAVARVSSSGGIIHHAHIAILYNPQDTLTSLRRNIVLEEIVQALGIPGDSYAYPESLFFQNYNPSKHFNPLDSAVLSLLYEDAIPFDYPRQSFENAFADVLYPVDAEEKINDLLKSAPQELLTSNEVEASFTGNELLKHPQQVVVLLKGSVGQADSVTLEMAIGSLNKISPNLRIRVARPDDGEPDYGIVLNFLQLDSQAEPIKRNIDILKGKDCMFPRLTKSKVVLSFNRSDKARKFRPQSLVDALYFSLIPLPQNQLRGKKVATIGPDLIRFDEHAANLLKLIYSPELVGGLKLSDFKKIKASIKKTTVAEGK